MGNSQSGKKQDLNIDRTKSQVHEDWTISPGYARDIPVTVFSAIHPPSSKKRDYMQKSLQFSKIFRHPGILKYMEGGVSNGEVMIVTEKATPLLEHDLESISHLELTAGLLSILDSLIFLHDKAGVSHNNVGLSSIFVTADGTWKLWCFEYSCSFGELSRDTIERVNQYCSEKFMPPDEKTHITPAYQHARDCYSYAKLVTLLTENRNEAGMPFLTDFIKYLHKNALSDDWNDRVRLSVIAEQNFFKHEFLKLRYDVTHALLLPEDEREKLIRSLPDLLRSYPEDLVASSLLPALLSRPILHIESSNKYLIPALMVPNQGTNEGLFTPQVFERFMVPLIIKLFSVYDATIRHVLLRYFKYYVDLIDRNELTNELLPLLLLGIRDSNDEIVSETLEALATLVPVLGASVVVGTRRESVFGNSKTRTRPKKKYAPPIVISSELSVPPVRSAPDGGEVLIESPPPTVDNQWSDWEDDTANDPKPASPKVKSKSKTRKESVSSVVSSASSSSSRSSAMQLRPKIATTKKDNEPLGKEFEIAPIKVPKKDDDDMDLFADLKPQLKANTFNLESMLIRASNATNEPASTLTKALADMDDLIENDAWGDENDWNQSDSEQIDNKDLL